MRSRQGTSAGGEFRIIYLKTAVWGCNAESKFPPAQPHLEKHHLFFSSFFLARRRDVHAVIFSELFVTFNLINKQRDVVSSSARSLHSRATRSVGFAGKGKTVDRGAEARAACFEHIPRPSIFIQIFAAQLVISYS